MEYIYHEGIMLIETMTPEEVSKEIKRDYDELSKPDGTFLRLGKEYNKRRIKFKISKSLSYPYFSEIKTKSKNHWLVLSSKAPSVNNYDGVGSINQLYIVYYYTTKGIRAFKTIPNESGTGYGGLSVFNSHLFTRYRERMGIRISSPEETIKHFFINNGYFNVKMIPKGDRTELFAVCTDGVVFGDLQNNDEWLVFKTFISPELMREDQTEEEKELIESLQTEINEELNNIEFDRDKYNYKADAMLGIQRGKK